MTDPTLEMLVATLVAALRGAVAIAVLTTLTGGIPRLVQLGLALFIGLWSALLVDVTMPDELLLAAARELVTGATIGVVAAVPLLAAATAARIVDFAGNARGTYRGLFGVLAAAVFVGIDGHVTIIVAIAHSHREMPADALGAIGTLVESAVRLAVPWLVTAAVVELAVGIGGRVAGRSAASVQGLGAAAVPAALAMMTAALVATFAVGFARLVLLR